MNMEQWGLDSRDTSRAAAALQADETVELVVKPRAKMDSMMGFLRVGGGVLLGADKSPSSGAGAGLVVG